MKKWLPLLLFAVGSIFFLACNSGNDIAEENHAPPTRSPILEQDKNEAKQTEIRSLCDELNEIKVIPYHYGKKGVDPIYDRLAANRKDAIPCLIEKITDETKMTDPRTAPKYVDFRVGDAAVFLLLMFTEENWQPDAMLSEDFAAKWESQGVYAYFEYVQDPENRKGIQKWWREWARRSLDDPA